MKKLIFITILAQASYALAEINSSRLLGSANCVQRYNGDLGSASVEYKASVYLGTNGIKISSKRRAADPFSHPRAGGEINSSDLKASGSKIVGTFNGEKLDLYSSKPTIEKNKFVLTRDGLVADKAVHYETQHTNRVTHSQHLNRYQCKFEEDLDESFYLLLQQELSQNKQ